MARQLGILVATLALVLEARAGDLVVNPGKPSAFPTLQAALDAAQPGDRILIETDLAFAATTKNVVRKSVTIESVDDSRKLIGYSSTVGLQVPRFEIESLTPGMPLVLRRLEFIFFSMGTSPGSPGIATRGSIPGEVRLEDVAVRWFETPNYTIWSGLAMRIECTQLWMRNCELFAADTLDRNGCVDIDDTRGSSSLEFSGDLLLLERCSLRAGSANFLYYSPCWNGSGQHPHGGRGGTALTARSRHTILVATELSDGNGGSVQAGPWNLAPSAGAAGQSSFVSTGGIASFWASGLVSGRPGVIDAGAPDRTRGQRAALGGPDTQVRLAGSGRLGESFRIEVMVNESRPAAVLLSAGLKPLTVHFGVLLPDIARVLAVLPFLGSGNLQIPIPTDPLFIDVMIAAQVAEQYAIQLGNPSSISIRR